MSLGAIDRKFSVYCLVTVIALDNSMKGIHLPVRNGRRVLHARRWLQVEKYLRTTPSTG